ncbi:MAG TPA: GerMN domain-containing protein, partial [Nocardioidaceae bacterium]
MSTVRRSYAARFVVALMVVGVSTACVSIPESSSVHAGRGPSAQDERPLSSNTPNGPRPGAGRKEIATGYLSAMLAFPPAPDVVREFLTPEAATAWNPEQGLVVYTESSRPRLSETANFVIFSARALGSLDERGSWSTATGPRREIRAAFAMERVGGEWRLRNPLPGTYVDQDYFSTYYDAFSLYFFEATNTILAADPVHMLLGDSLATSLVEDLLKGPTRELQGAVGSSMPTTATVTTAVTISPSGVAEIPLSDEILQLSANDRRLFAAQLVWTLQPL